MGVLREALAQGLDVGARDHVTAVRDEILHRQAAGSLVEHAAWGTFPRQWQTFSLDS